MCYASRYVDVAKTLASAFAWQKQAIFLCGGHLKFALALLSNYDYTTYKTQRSLEKKTDLIIVLILNSNDTRHFFYMAHTACKYHLTWVIFFPLI